MHSVEQSLIVMTWCDFCGSVSTQKKIQKSKNEKDFARKLQVICLNWNLCTKLHLNKNHKNSFHMLVAYGWLAFVPLILDADLLMSSTCNLQSLSVFNIEQHCRWLTEQFEYITYWIEIAFFWPIVVFLPSVAQKINFFRIFEFHMYMNIIYGVCTLHAWESNSEIY